MQTIDNFNFSGKKAIVRVDFNVPLDKKTFVVTDDTRIRGALPTIQKILKDGGSAILMSHLGRPDGKVQEKYSLKHVVSTVEKVVGTTVKFASDCMGDATKKMAAELKAGEILLLENLRFYEEEEGKPYHLGENATEEEKKEALFDIKELIFKLNRIVQQKDFEAWYSYLSPNFITYYSNPDVLAEISNQPTMRKYNIVLKTLKDYFLYVVYPSRQNDTVDEIEYIGYNKVKVYTIVNNVKLVLYVLEKINGTWMISR